MKEIAHAILLVDGAYVLQLRDDIPGIGARRIQTLFGGASKNAPRALLPVTLEGRLTAEPIR